MEVSELSKGRAFDHDCEARCEPQNDDFCVRWAIGIGRSQDCMWAELYAGERVEQWFTLEASDFADWEGATVYARLEDAHILQPVLTFRA